MRVGVDGRSLRESRSSRGIAVYTSCLLDALARRFPGDHYAVLVPGGAPAPPASSVCFRGEHLPGRLVYGASALARRPALGRLLPACNVLWLPAPAPLAVSPPPPYVLTVHDLSFEHRARDYGLYERLWHRLARPRGLAAGARLVIAVSEVVRRQLIGEWGLQPDKVRAVPSGPGRPLRSTASSLPAGVEPPYFLAVGALEPRKRPLLLAGAHARAKARGLRASLLFAGDGPLRPRFEASGSTVLGFIPDDELDALYSGALALLCPSREEGFGFTPLEALARGTPAVVGDLPIFQETLGDSALRVRPGDPEALTAALLRLERDAGFRQRLLVGAEEVLRRHSWESAAAGTRAVLEEAALDG